MNAPLRSGPRLGAPVSRTARSACSPASQKENTPMTPWTLRIAALALATSAGTAFAHGNVECKPHPKSEWRPHSELEKKLTEEGWKVRRMERKRTMDRSHDNPALCAGCGYRSTCDQSLAD